MNLTAILIFSALFLALVFITVAVESDDRRAREEKRGWRIKLLPPGTWHYQEKRDGAWIGVRIPLITIEHRYSRLSLPTDDAWMKSPVWLSSRREEIIARIKSELPELTAMEER